MLREHASRKCFESEISTHHIVLWTPTDLRKINTNADRPHLQADSPHQGRLPCQGTVATWIPTLVVGESYLSKFVFSSFCPTTKNWGAGFFSNNMLREMHRESASKVKYPLSNPRSSCIVRWTPTNLQKINTNADRPNLQADSPHEGRLHWFD